MKMQKKKKEAFLMTEGVIWRRLIRFSIPLLIGNLFQQLYNTVDSIVVGQFIGSDALAAVGTSTPLINLIIGMFMGISVGAGVVISQYYGAKNKERMSLAVHTSIALSIVGGLILTVAGILFAPAILRLMKTPPEVMADSLLYFRIFFMGSVFNLLYNIGAGILRAVGDSKRPLYFLCISTLINSLLDLLFVAKFHMGVEGVAYATVLSLFLCSVLMLTALSRTEDMYRLELKKIRIDREMMKRILKLGIPSGIQQSIISLSNVIVQTNVNAYGAMAMAGFGAYNKIDGFVVLPMQSFCMAATTFTGQNIGAGKKERVNEGTKQGMIICLVYTVLISIFLFFQSGSLLKIFSSDRGVIEYGIKTMLIMIPFYTALSAHEILMGTLCGAGKSMQTMWISIGNMCILRILYIYILVPLFPSFEAIIWCYPITWISTAAMDFIYMKKGKWKTELE